MKKLGIMMILAVLWLGCSQRASVGGSGSSSSGMEFSVEKVYMGETIEIRSSQAGRLQAFDWGVANEDGFDLIHQCVSIEGGAGISCNFDEAGEITITLSAKTRDGEVVQFESVVDVLDPAERSDQPPVIILAIRGLSGALQAKLSNNLRLETGSTSMVAGTYSFDFSASQDEDPVSQLKFEMSFSGGGFVSAPSSYDFPVAAQEVTVRATDTAGNTSEKHFIVYGQCEGPNDLAIGGVSATHSDGNLFEFSATVSGGRDGGKKLMWDYNGDGVYDGDWVDVNESNVKYTNFAGARTLKVKAWDTLCNYQVEKEVTLNFATPRLNHDGNINTPSQVLEFGNSTNYFIQADLSGLLGNEAPHANGDFIITKRPGQEPEDTVKCPFDPDTGTLQIAGLNHYDSLAGVGRRHGMELRIKGVTSTPGAQSNATISTAIYRSDEQDDTNLYQQLTYYESNCDLSLIMDKADAVKPCGDGSSVAAPVYIFYGKYNCGNMSSSVRDMEAVNGAFYCEMQDPAQCYGGGGGGGGGAPPIEY